jgi:HSP20 family protein
MSGSILQRASEREREREKELATRSGYNSGYSNGPHSVMRRFSDEVDRFFTHAFGSAPDSAGAEMAAWSPAVEVRERGGNLEVTAELPGLKKEDVTVECTDDGLIIQGERRQEREETVGGIRRSERVYGHFYRLIPLPPGADPDNATAEFRDGLLQIRIPVVENKQKRRSIPIAV